MSPASLAPNSLSDCEDILAVSVLPDGERTRLACRRRRPGDDFPSSDPSPADNDSTTQGPKRSARRRTSQASGPRSPFLLNCCGLGNGGLTFLLAGSVLTAIAGRAEMVAPVVPSEARPLPLSAVRLTGGPLKQAQDLDAEYLLKLESDRMLAYLRIRAGLEPKAQGYGGWDGDGRQLTGHIAGHNLSAVSYLWAATHDPRFKERADYIVRELKEVQEKQGDGYLGALMGTSKGQRNAPPVDGKILFQQLAEGTINSSGFDLNGMWSPWYVQHKIFAGLRDAYRLTGNRDALEVEIQFARWVDGILAKLNDDQIQRMLRTEFGGMNEVLVDLYADTGDPRWLALSERFEHRAIVEPLARHEDILGSKHGNTLVPKLLGELVRYLYTGRQTNGSAAQFFWDRVTEHHSFATGGHGRNEYFGRPDQLNDMVDGRTAETCNVYNMLKLTRRLFALQPDVRYAEFHERALFNHILASIDPVDGRTCYMVPVGRGVQREYQGMMSSFTCCVGSGMESHALHGDGIYFESGNKFWVSLYAPSVAEWKEAEAVLNMDTGFPEGDSATLKITLQRSKQFTLALRRPSWAGDGFSVAVNGDTVKDLPQPGAYVELLRTWKGGDTVALVMPKTLRQEPLPDNPRRVALLWGPLVLAGDLGPEQQGAGRGRGGRGSRTNPLAAPVFVAAHQPVATWLKPVPDKPGTFRTDGVGREEDVEFAPFYRLHRRQYGVYWDLFTPEEWEKKSAAYVAEQARQRKLEAATVGFAQPGEMQPERDYNFQGEGATIDHVMERAARRGTNWFSFDLPVDSAHPMLLVVTYNSGERQKRTFEILVDGQRLGEQTMEGSSPEQATRFFDVEYSVPAAAVKNKQKVTVRFQAANGSEIASVFGIRMIRADAER